MKWQGVVTNNVNFGAFVDIGVHQDGFIHISELSEEFVDDPHTVIKTGEIVHVKVVDIDVACKRITLSRKKWSGSHKHRH